MTELVAGPLCGMKVKWPHPDKRGSFRYPHGFAVYEIEKGGNTAIYKHDE